MKSMWGWHVYRTGGQWTKLETIKLYTQVMRNYGLSKHSGGTAGHSYAQNEAFCNHLLYPTTE